MTGAMTGAKTGAMAGAVTGTPGDLDRMQFAIEHLLDAPDGWRPLVREMVARWPEAPAGEVILAIVAAATEIEQMFGPGSPSREGAAQGWRLAALVGADLCAMAAVGLPHVTAGDMARYWKIDPWFRDL